MLHPVLDLIIRFFYCLQWKFTGLMSIHKFQLSALFVQIFPSVQAPQHYTEKLPALKLSPTMPTVNKALRTEYNVTETRSGEEKHLIEQHDAVNDNCDGNGDDDSALSFTLGFHTRHPYR